MNSITFCIMTQKTLLRINLIQMTTLKQFKIIWKRNLLPFKFYKFVSNLFHFRD